MILHSKFAKMCFDALSCEDAFELIAATSGGVAPEGAEVNQVLSLVDVFRDVLILLNEGETLGHRVRVERAIRLYNSLTPRMEPVFALRSAIIHLTTPEANTALGNHVNSRTHS